MSSQRLTITGACPSCGRRVTMITDLPRGISRVEDWGRVTIELHCDECDDDFAAVQELEGDHGNRGEGNMRRVWKRHAGAGDAQDQGVVPRVRGDEYDGTEDWEERCRQDEARRRVKGDRCPIGPLQLHTWDGDECRHCKGTR